MMTSQSHSNSRPPSAMARPSTLHVTGHDRDAAGADFVEVAAPCAAQPLEGVVAEDLPLDTAVHVGTAAWPHQQHQLAVGDRAQQPFDESSAQESSCTGDGDALSGQRVGDHDVLSSPIGAQIRARRRNLPTLLMRMAQQRTQRSTQRTAERRLSLPASRTTMRTARSRFPAVRRWPDRGTQLLR